MSGDNPKDDRKKTETPPEHSEPPSLFDNLEHLFESADESGQATKKKDGKPVEAKAQSKRRVATDKTEKEPPEAGEPKSTATLYGGRGPLRELINDNFLQFASYTICNRAIPTVEDGLKPVQRRIMHSLWEKDDGRLIKVANVVGHTMQYHPHGDASIGDAIVNLANKRYLIERQGNFGNIFTGDPAAAMRYIECRLTDLARNEIFNSKLTDFIASYDGRNKEPLLLPSKLPLLLMLGAEGIAVGLSTYILPHNFNELIEAQIAIIRKKPFEVLPDFITGGLMDASEYDDGMGRIKLRARIEQYPKKRCLVITEIPWNTTTESLIADIEEAAKNKRVPIREINDFTSDKVEIELVLTAGTNPEKAIQTLFAFTKCETTISSRPVVLFQNRPREMSVSEMLRVNTEQLLDLVKRELELRRDQLDDAFHAKTLEQIFIEERIYKRIEEETTYEAVQQAVIEGFKPFQSRLRREITLDDIERLLQIRIRRISRYDINKNREEIEAILKEEAEVEHNLKNLRAYVIKYLRGLLKKYGKAYPRQTEIVEKSFKPIEIRKLTASELTLKIDTETGFIGTELRGGEELFKCSSLDKIIVVWNDGRYKMMPPPDKFLVDGDYCYIELYHRDKEFTTVYTEDQYGFTYIKRFTFGGLIQNRDYRLAPEKSKILLFEEGVPEQIFVRYKPAKGQRIHQQVFDPSEVAIRGVGTRGKQMTSKPIARIGSSKPRNWKDDEGSPKGILL